MTVTSKASKHAEIRRTSVFSRAVAWAAVERAQHALNLKAQDLAECAEVMAAFDAARGVWAQARGADAVAEAWRGFARAQGCVNVRAITCSALAIESKELEAALAFYHALHDDGSPALDRLPGVGGLA